MSRKRLIDCRLSATFALMSLAMFCGCGNSADSPAVTLERARILMERDQAAEAVPLLDTVIAAVPEDAEARYQRGVAYESLDVLEKAIVDYTECLRLDSERTDALNNKAVVLAKMERFEEAAAEFSRLVELDPQGSLAYRNRALCHFDLKQYDVALADYAKAIELDPKDPANWFQRAGVYFEQARYAEAEQDYTKAIELEEGLARAWMNRGVARYKRGEKSLAAEDLKKAQSLDDNIVLPDIDFFGNDSTTSSATEILPDSDWAAQRTVAEQELTDRGFSTLTLVREYPSFRCAEYTGKFAGKTRTVFVASCADDQTSYALPSNASARSEAAQTKQEFSLLVLKSGNDFEAGAEVCQFEQHWDPSTASSEPVILRYELDADPKK